MYSTNRDQVRELLLHISKRTKGEFEKFKDALREVSQTEALRLLEDPPVGCCLFY